MFPSIGVTWRFVCRIVHVGSCSPSSVKRKELQSSVSRFDFAVSGEVLNDFESEITLVSYHIILSKCLLQLLIMRMLTMKSSQNLVCSKSSSNIDKWSCKKRGTLSPTISSRGFDEAHFSSSFRSTQGRIFFLL